MASTNLNRWIRSARTGVTLTTAALPNGNRSLWLKVATTAFGAGVLLIEAKV